MDVYSAGAWWSAVFTIFLPASNSFDTISIAGVRSALVVDGSGGLRRALWSSGATSR